MMNLHHLGGNIGGQTATSGWPSGPGTGGTTATCGSAKIVHLTTSGTSLKKNFTDSFQTKWC